MMCEISERGTIFNIQKFSLHDGPGIRTTVFLKGCPLSCKWCANPESQMAKIQIMYDSQKCVRCQTCVHTCQQQAITMDERQHIHINFAKCIGCLACIHACPANAIHNEGEGKTVTEILAVCRQDIDFYEESGGGVTISGGEGMMQPAFVEALLQKLKAENIHTAIETTGHVAEEIFQRLAPQFDLLLFDVKHYDNSKHKEGTSVGNELIIKNLRWAYENKLNILPRIPVIPGFNSSLADAQGIAGLLTSIGLKEVQLLPFHQMGERKYELLNRSYKLKGQKALYPEDLQEYQEIFLAEGLDCFFSKP